jgi:hypothetical protein
MYDLNCCLKCGEGMDGTTTFPALLVSMVPYRQSYFEINVVVPGKISIFIFDGTEYGLTVLGTSAEGLRYSSVPLILPQWISRAFCLQGTP